MVQAEVGIEGAKKWSQSLEKAGGKVVLGLCTLEIRQSRDPESLSETLTRI